MGAYAMRTCAIAPIAVSILMWTAFGNAFAALPAPVGHRQPNASNVPANVLGAEPKTNAKDIDFDKMLNICRGC
jgi:hypothetical protein